MSFILALCLLVSTEKEPDFPFTVEVGESHLMVLDIPEEQKTRLNITYKASEELDGNYFRLKRKERRGIIYNYSLFLYGDNLEGTFSILVPKEIEGKVCFYVVPLSISNEGKIEIKKIEIKKIQR